MNTFSAMEFEATTRSRDHKSTAASTAADSFFSSDSSTPDFVDELSHMNDETMNDETMATFPMNDETLMNSLTQLDLAEGHTKSKKKKKKSKDKNKDDSKKSKKKKRKSSMRDDITSSASVETDLWEANRDDWSQWGNDKGQDGAMDDDASFGISSIPQKKPQLTASAASTSTPSAPKLASTRLSPFLEHRGGGGYLPSGARFPDTIDRTPDGHMADIMSVLSGDDLQSVNQMIEEDDVPPDLLVEYMMAMGANRKVAEQLARTFLAEQQGATSALSAKSREAARSNRARDPARQAHASSLRQKLQAVEEHAPTSTRMTSTLSVHSSDFVHAAPPPTYASPFNYTGSSVPAGAPGAPIVEAMPVKDFGDVEGGFPVIYADSTPISLKHLVRERPVRRFIILGVCLVIAGIIFGVVYSVIGTGRKSEGGDIETNFPTMAPSMAPTFISSEIFQAAIRLSGGIAFDEPGSPQFQAVGWLSSKDQIDTGGTNGESFAQRYALVTLYFGLKGEEWTNQEQWLDPTLHECEWSSGIFCQYDATETRVVTGLDATRNNLQGTLPAEVGLLKSASTLRLPKNRIVGQIPDSIGDLSSLSAMDLSNNELIGSIPSTIGGAKDLIQLDLSFNQLNGTMPSGLYSLRFLRTLKLNTNMFSGMLNEEVNNLQVLVTLDIRHNEFSGEFPIDFESLPALDIIYLDYNQFSGTLPPLTGATIKKQILSISHNRFRGNMEVDTTYILSPNISDFRLQYVDLGYNELSGPISPIIGFLPTMRHFDLSGNGFFGTFPSNMGWASIEFFAAADNLLTGTLPIGLPTLSKFENHDEHYATK